MLARVRRLFGAVGARKSYPDDVLRLLMAGADSKSGQGVNWQTALQVSTVLACARAIAGDLASVPWKVKRRRADGGADDATDHPVYPLLQASPNPFQTAYEMREQLAIHTVLTGNAFALLNVVRRGVIREILPLEPGWVTLKTGTDPWAPIYKVRYPGSNVEEEIPAANIWHWRGAAWSSWVGLDVVRLAREAIGLAMATEEHGARLFGNGGRPSGLLSTEQTLAPDKLDELRKGWQAAYGAENSGKTAVLSGGLKWQPVSMDSDKAQYLETRRLQIEEVCRTMGVFPARVGVSDKATTYASAEQFFLAHAVFTLAPWAQRFDQSANMHLLRDTSGATFTKHNLNGLMRGAAADRAAFYKSGIIDGWLTRNDVRAYEDLNPLDGLDVPLIPLNMGDGTKPPAPKAEPAPAGAPPADDPEE